MNVGSLFSGIGGFDLGFQRAGMHTSWFCEQDPYCQRVLAKHWPDVPCYPDVTELRGADVEPVDVLSGGFPCQPVSRVGLRRGQDDERWIWPEFSRLICELRPRYVVVENVPGLLTHGMGDVLGDLASLRYDAEWDCIPALALGAPHTRDRVWVVAYANALGCDGGGRQSGSRRRDEFEDGRRVFPYPGEGRHWTQAEPLCPGGNGAEHSGGWPTEPALPRMAHGVPNRVDRVAALGNALVPQIAEWIGHRLMAYENRDRTGEILPW